MHSKLSLLVIGLLSCGTVVQEDNDTPTALQEHGVVDQLATEVKSVSSRSGYGRDLVEDLFLDALKKDTALARVLSEVEQRQEEHPDIVAPFDRAMGLSAAYYGDAKSHAMQVNDSVVMDRELAILARSEASFKTYTSSADRIRSEYERTETRMGDLVEVLKLQRTLALMESHQMKEGNFEALWKEELARLQALEKALEAQRK